MDNIAELEPSEITQVHNDNPDLDHNSSSNDMSQITPQSSRKNTFRHRPGVTPSIETAFRRISSYKGKCCRSIMKWN